MYTHEPDKPHESAPGVRLGPVVWVPELLSKPGDPWAHRKGEPRPLAIFWSIYLMGAALLTLFRVRSLSMPSTEQFVTGCRGMIVMVAIGLFVLWPMTRLSQEFPARSARSLLSDLGVLLIPVQAVVWPMPLLTHWSWSVTGALALLLISWSIVAAGVLRLAHAQRFPRGVACAITLLLGSAGPLIAFFITLPAPLDRLARLVSPFTGSFELTFAPSGLAPVMQSWEWGGILAPAFLGAALWTFGTTQEHGSDHGRDPLASTPPAG